MSGCGDVLSGCRTLSDDYCVGGVWSGLRCCWRGVWYCEESGGQQGCGFVEFGAWCLFFSGGGGSLFDACLDGDLFVGPVVV